MDEESHDLLSRQHHQPTLRPDDFQRRVEITDPELLLLVTQVDHLADEVGVAKARLRAAIGRHLAAFEELGLRLRDVHPGIHLPTAGGSAYFRHGGKVYYASWDDEDMQEPVREEKGE